MEAKDQGWYFEILGSSGGRARGRYTMCIYLPPSILLDAGNVFSLSEESILQINHVFVTHSHLDHFVDMPFLIDFTYSLRETPLRVYGLRDTLESLRKNIMNWDIWPEFGSLTLPTTGDIAVDYVPIEPESQVEIEGYSIIPFMSKHTVPTLGLIVKKNGRGFVYTSDTYKNPHLWARVEEDREIKLVIVDVSFPSYMSNLAHASLHNTPESLREDMQLLKRKDLKFYAVHLKPSHEVEVVKELRAFNHKVYPVLGRKKIKV